MRREIVTALKRHLIPDKDVRVDYRLVKGADLSDDHSLTAICKQLEAFGNAIARRQPWMITVQHDIGPDSPRLEFHWKEAVDIKHRMNALVSRHLVYTIQPRVTIEYA